MPPGSVPDLVNDQTPDSRAASTVLALEKASIGEGMDENVNLAELQARQAYPDSLPRLDDVTMAPQFDSWRPLEDSAAVTTRGREAPVRYGLAEIGDLTTSHDDDFVPNSQFPPELQPRERDRAGAQVHNLQIEEDFNPKLVMRDVAAGAGAPIIAPDGVVEAGNGRIIILRRSARRGSPAYQLYLAELKAQGFNTDGMKEPVLVRMRTQPMQGAERAAWTSEANADVTERMSLTEQATADAKRLDDETLAVLGEEDAGARRRFAKVFLTRVAPDQINSLVDERGNLTQDGERRVAAALMAKAYGDPRLVEAVFEEAEPNIKAIGAALREGAPAWAAMRAAAATGKIPPSLDLTGPLREAVNLVRHFRDKGMNVREAIKERLAQRALFQEDSVGPEAEGFLRLFFAKDFSRPYGAAKIADVLKEYARAALEESPEPNMLGELADESTARQIFANAYKRDREPLELTVRPPGEPSGPEAGAIRDPVVSVQETGGGGERPGGEGLPERGGGEAGRNGARQGGPAAVDEPAADRGRPGAGAGGEPAAGVGAGAEGVGGLDVPALEEAPAGLDTGAQRPEPGVDLGDSAVKDAETPGRYVEVRLKNGEPVRLVNYQGGEGQEDSAGIYAVKDGRVVGSLLYSTAELEPGKRQNPSVLVEKSLRRQERWRWRCTTLRGSDPAGLIPALDEEGQLTGIFRCRTSRGWARRRWSSGGRLTTCRAAKPIAGCTPATKSPR